MIMDTESDQNGRPPRSELIATAWHLSTQEGLSTRKVAERMGIPHSTARDYIRAGGEAEAWIDLMDRAEARQALAVRTIKILDRLDKAMDEDPDRTLEVAPVWFKGAGQLATLLGLNAPTRVHHEGPGAANAPQPDPETAAAIRAAQQQAARERAQIRGETALVVPPDEQNENGEQ